jgi:uncharacterized protein (TIGR00661 family)
MNIIYGVCSWGIGHATRSLPIMRKLIDEHNTVTTISSGRALELLEKELGENGSYVDVPDYPMLSAENSRLFIIKSMFYWPLILKGIELGHIKLSKVLRKQHCDLIISDSRYDMYCRKIPSLLISHQMRIMNPFRIKLLDSMIELFNLLIFKRSILSERFTRVLVPDYKENDLSGDLSHNLRIMNRIDEDYVNYVGVLSDLERMPLKKDIDYLISISGAEPQRTFFEEKLLSQVHELEGTVVLTLGKTEKYTKVEENNVVTYSFVTKEKREELMNRAKIVICRSGYSTIMDLGVIGTKALLIPTTGQIEQEYLANYHRRKGTFYSVSQDSINLLVDIQKARRTTGITRDCDVHKTVQNVMDAIAEIP